MVPSECCRWLPAAYSCSPQQESSETQEAAKVKESSINVTMGPNKELKAKERTTRPNEIRSPGKLTELSGVSTTGRGASHQAVKGKGSQGSLTNPHTKNLKATDGPMRHSGLRDPRNSANSKGHTSTNRGTSQVGSSEETNTSSSETLSGCGLEGESIEVATFPLSSLPFPREAIADLYLRLDCPVTAPHKACHYRWNDYNRPRAIKVLEAKGSDMTDDEFAIYSGFGNAHWRCTPDEANCSLCKNTWIKPGS